MPSVNPTIATAQKRAETTLAGSSGISYPSDLLSESENRAVRISVHNYNKGKIDSKERRFPVFTFFLPMPLELNDEVRHEYNEFGGLLNRLINTVKTTPEGEDKAAALGIDLAVSAGRGALGNDAGAIQRELGGIQLNPRSSVFFSNPVLKTHTFRYVMIPKNEQESNNIQLIIDKIRYHSHPGILGNGNVFTHPELFQIEFIPNDDYLFKPNACVMESFNVSYNDQTQGAFFKNGAPTEVQLTMVFREVEFDTKELLDKKYSNILNLV